MSNVESSQGEWILLYDADVIKAYKCSICGYVEIIGAFERVPFCQCGAKMKSNTEK